MVPQLDAADRHLLAVAAVWITVIVFGLFGGAVLLGLAFRLFYWVMTG